MDKAKAKAKVKVKATAKAKAIVVDVFVVFIVVVVGGSILVTQPPRRPRHPPRPLDVARVPTIRATDVVRFERAGEIRKDTSVEETMDMVLHPRHTMSGTILDGGIPLGEYASNPTRLVQSFRPLTEDEAQIHQPRIDHDAFAHAG